MRLLVLTVVLLTLAGCSQKVWEQMCVADCVRKGGIFENCKPSCHLAWENFHE